MRKGGSYTDTGNTIHIGFLDFSLFPDDREFYATNYLMNARSCRNNIATSTTSSYNKIELKKQHPMGRKERGKLMDEKMREAFKNFYTNLTDEQKEKVRAFKTPGEIVKQAGEWGVEVPDELLDAVAGGWEPMYGPVGYVWDEKRSMWV